MKIVDLKGHGRIYERSIAALHNKHLGVLNNEELQYCMAEMRYHMTDTIKKKKYPEPPAALINFRYDRQSSDWHRMKEVDREEKAMLITNSAEVIRYNTLLAEAVGDNLSTVWWLENDIKLWMDMDCVDRAKKCYDLYSTFITIRSGHTLLWKRKSIKEICDGESNKEGSCEADSEEVGNISGENGEGS